MFRRWVARGLKSYVYRTPLVPGRGLVGKLAYHLDPTPFTAEIAPGVQFSIRLHVGDDISYWVGRSERHGETRLFQSLVQTGSVVFDVGANLGLYSLIAANAVGPEGRVYGFEPSPTLFARLCEHIALNGTSNLVAVPLAASARSGTATFYPNETKNSETSLGSLVRQMGGRAIEVETIALDDYQGREGIGRVSLVKIDVEGAEQLVLDGMPRILREDRPALLIEHNDEALKRQSSSAKELFRRVLGSGYAAALIRDGKAIPVDALQPPVYSGSEPYSNYIFRPR